MFSINYQNSLISQSSETTKNKHLQPYKTFRNCPRISIADLNGAERQLIELMGFNDLEYLLMVPVRKRGITSSGISDYSNRNVLALCEIFGGRQVFGIAVEMSRKNTYAIARMYCCWETPEGKLVDVGRVDRKCVKFIPLINYHSSMLVIHQLECVHFKPDEEKPFIIDWLDIGEKGSFSHESCYSFDEGVRFLRKIVCETLIEFPSVETEPFTDEELDRFFKDPSAFTGEKLSEIRRRKQANI